MSFVYGTTMNYRLYNFYGEKNINKTFPFVKDSKFFLFHENSVELNDKINLQELPNYVSTIDLFIVNNWMNDFLKTSPFNNCIELEEYYNKYSDLWFRKVVAITELIRRSEIGDIAIWLDCDSYVIKELSNEMIDYAKRNDILAIFRKNDWVESGNYIFNINDKVKQWAEYYLQFYTSGRVFELPYWADNYVSGYTFEENKFNLKLSGLTKQFGSPYDISEFMKHEKGSDAKFRNAE